MVRLFALLAEAVTTAHLMLHIHVPACHGICLLFTLYAPDSLALMH